MISRCEQKAQTYSVILAVAREIFIEKGYEAANIREIARSAGVSLGTIHAHFKSKKGLLLSCFQKQLEDAMGQGFLSLEREAPLVEQLCHLAGSLYRAYSQYPALSRAMFLQSLFPEEPASDPLLDEFLLAIAEIYRRAMERGEIKRLPREGLSAAQGFFAFYLSVLIGGLSGHWGAEEGEEAAVLWTQVLDGMLRLQLVGLGAEEALLEGVS